MKSGLKSPCLFPSVCIEPPLGALDTQLDLCHACDSGTQCPLMITHIIRIYTLYAALYIIFLCAANAPWASHILDALSTYRFCRSTLNTSN